MKDGSENKMKFYKKSRKKIKKKKTEVNISRNKRTMKS